MRRLILLFLVSFIALGKDPKYCDKHGCCVDKCPCVKKCTCGCSCKRK